MSIFNGKAIADVTALFLTSSLRRCQQKLFTESDKLFYMPM